MLQYLRMKDVIARTTLPKTDIWEEIKKDKFPHPFKLKENGNTNVWDSFDIDLWMYYRKSGITIPFTDFLKANPNPELTKFDEIIQKNKEKNHEEKK